MNFKQRLDRYLTQSDESRLPDENSLPFESLEFANEFDYDDHGLITNPGKFERECKYVPYFWNMVMHGASDESNMGFEVFHIGPEDIDIFPELKDIDSVTVYECSQGFVYALLEESD